ncbi:unnamed protein product [Citrullus colocynthis]|uniref:Uncharacterized protein n=1 Tax=Citrullus colocynthis TaxID=252529 RepID=A0ABP0XT18_9ROSI
MASKKLFSRIGILLLLVFLLGDIGVKRAKIDSQWSWDDNPWENGGSGSTNPPDTAALTSRGSLGVFHVLVLRLNRAAGGLGVEDSNTPSLVSGKWRSGRAGLGFQGQFPAAYLRAGVSLGLETVKHAVGFPFLQSNGNLEVDIKIVGIFQGC